MRRKGTALLRTSKAPGMVMCRIYKAASAKSLTQMERWLYNNHGFIKRSNLDVGVSNMTAEEAFGTEIIRSSEFKDVHYADRRKWNLQQYLNRYNSYKIPVDGYWGKQTRDAIVSFQISHNLKVDGETGPATWEKLVK